MNERSESRRRKYSSSTKAKLDVELPKINRTTFLLKDGQRFNTSVIVPAFADKVSWVIESKDYTTLTDKQIEDEYSRLRKQLQVMNSEVEKAIEKFDVRVLKKSKISEHDPARTLEITDKQVDNNNAILDRLRKEYLQLQKRSTMVTASSKDQVQQEIEKTKAEIEKCKSKIKELKMKNKTIGESIVNSDDIYEEIKRLESEKEVGDRKKMKLQSKTDHVYQQISASELKLQEINDNFLIAQNFFQQCHEKSQQSEQHKQMQMKYQHARHCLEVVTRKCESGNNSKQQKYHILLKNYEVQSEKINVLEQKTASIELEIIHCKKLIHELEQIYKQNQLKRQILNQEPVFFTQFEQCGDKNDKNENSKLHKNQMSQRNKTENNKQNLNEQKKQNAKVVENKYQTQPQRQKAKQKQRLDTSNGVDPAQEEDIIVELDEKFTYKTKTNMRTSRYEKETEIGEDLPEDIVDEDDELTDFKVKVSEEKVNRKSKQGVNIAKDLDKIKNQIDKFDFMKANQDSYD